jgi:hypothetical protein
MQNGATFISGGIGIDSQERLTAREKEFNLKLVFTLAEQAGNRFPAATRERTLAACRTWLTFRGG